MLREGIKPDSGHLGNNHVLLMRSFTLFAVDALVHEIKRRMIHNGIAVFINFDLILMQNFRTLYSIEFKNM